MRMKIVAGAAIVALVAGTGAVLEAASNVTPPQRQTTTNEIDVPTVNPSSHTTQNPLVNPSAAGTQMGWRGYGASSRAVGETTGSESHGSVSPGAGEVSTPASVSPTAGQAKTRPEALERLKQLGYTEIRGLRKASAGGWFAVARRDNRDVHLRLDENGNIVGQH